MAVREAAEGRSAAPVTDTETYRGVEIVRVSQTTEDPTALEAYAVTDGVAMLASSTDDLKAVLDARAGAAGVSSSAGFWAAAGEVSADAQLLVYLDPRAIVSALRARLPAEARAEFDDEAGPNLAPLEAVALSMQTAPESLSLRLFVAIR